MFRQVAFGLILLLLVACSGQSVAEPVEPVSSVPSPVNSQEETQRPAGAPGEDVRRSTEIIDPASAPVEPLPDGVQLETIAGEEQGVSFPVAIAFLPDGRWLVTEKGGTGGVVDAVVHLFENDQKQAQPFVTIEVDSTFERGLLGVAIDPEFEQNRYVYLYYSRPGDPVVNTTVRYTERDGIGTKPQVIFEAPVVTGAGNHNGGNLHFGPDGKLYISIGENARPAFAQERDSLYGKIHRINPDGSVPADNPFAPAPGWVYGLRNPFDFTFDPLTGSLWATDNGPACDDELHVVQAGENGGWGPDYQCGQVPANTSAPVLRWSDTEAVTGVTIYNQETIPAWNGSLFVCAYSSGKLYRATLNAERTTITAVYQVELPGDARCRTDITPAPDGSIYIGDPPHIHRIVGQ